MNDIYSHRRCDLRRKSKIVFVKEKCVSQQTGKMVARKFSAALLSVLVTVAAAFEYNDCPQSCICDARSATVDCSARGLRELPARVPEGTKIL